jgi:hypothetical protein
LVGQVRKAEAEFEEIFSHGFEDLTPEKLLDYGKTLSGRDLKKRMRGLGLYFEYLGKNRLAKIAGTLREREISKTRKPFKLRNFRGMSRGDVLKLEAIGIVSVQDLLSRGKTPAERGQLARQTGLPIETVLKLVKLSDLSRLGAVKSVRAVLYYEAGLDTPAKFAEWDPESLRQMLVKFVERTGFDGIAPLPKELRNAVAVARKLPEIVEY